MTFPKEEAKGAGRGEKGAKVGIFWAAVVIMMAASFIAVFVIDSEANGYGSWPTVGYAFGVIVGAACVCYLYVVWAAAKIP
jgi:hypothetical protein